MTALRKTAPAWKAPTPTFYNPANAGVWNYRPNVAGVFNEAYDWRSTNSIRPAASDRKLVHLLGIDLQKDFCFPEGTLYVAGRSGTGAIDDTVRIASFIYRNLAYLSRITMTLDTHLAFQIFFRAFWTNADGTPIAAFTEIMSTDLKQGKFKLNVAAAGALGVDYIWLMKQCVYYCEELERMGKYKLYIWPEHCLLGTDGHTLVGLILEAVQFWAYVRNMQPDFQIKGTNPYTENYSVARPEVLLRYDGKPLAQKNVKLIQMLLKADYVIMCGQAASHCVSSSIDDFLQEILAQDPALARKVYIMSDCMSAVTVPDGKGGFYADFTPQAEGALKKFADHGMHVVSSADPIDSWPDFVL